jgi:hypothetical protein
MGAVTASLPGMYDRSRRRECPNAHRPYLESQRHPHQAAESLTIARDTLNLLRLILVGLRAPPPARLEVVRLCREPYAPKKPGKVIVQERDNQCRSAVDAKAHSIEIGVRAAAVAEAYRERDQSLYRQ